MFHWGCSFLEYAGMMSFVFTKPSLNLFLPFKNCSREHVWRLLHPIFQDVRVNAASKSNQLHGVVLPSPISVWTPTWSRSVSQCCHCRGISPTLNGLKENNAKFKTDFWSPTRITFPDTSPPRKGLSVKCVWVWLVLN